MSGVPAFGPDDPRRHDVLAPVLPKKQPGIEKLVGRALVPFFVPGSQDENVEQKVVEHSQDADEDSYAFNVAVRSFENGYFQEAKPIAPDFASYQQNNNHGRNQRRSNSDAQAPPALYPSPESLYSQLYPKPAHLDQPSYPPQNASAPRGRGGRGRGRGRGRGTGPASFSNGDSASGPTPKKAPRPKASQPSAPVPPTAYAGAAFMNAPSPDQMPLPSFLTSKVVSAPAPSAPSAPLSSPPLSPDAAAQATAQLNFLLATAKQSQAAPVDPATPPLSFIPAYAAVPPVTPPTQPPASTPIAPSPLLQAPFRRDSNPSTTAPVAQPQSSNRFFVSETQSSFSSLPATRSSDSVVSEPPQLAPSPLLPTAAIASRPIASPPAPPLSSAQPKLHLLTASPFKGGVPTKVSIQLVPSAAPAYSALPSPPAQASTPQRSSSLFTQPVAASNPNGAPSASPLQPSARALSFTDAQPAAQGASPPVVLANGGTAAAPTTADPVANASNRLKQMLSISS